MCGGLYVSCFESLRVRSTDVIVRGFLRIYFCEVKTKTPYRLRAPLICQEPGPQSERALYAVVLILPTPPFLVDD